MPLARPAAPASASSARPASAARSTRARASSAAPARARRHRLRRSCGAHCWTTVALALAQRATSRLEGLAPFSQHPSWNSVPAANQVASPLLHHSQFRLSLSPPLHPSNSRSGGTAPCPSSSAPSPAPLIFPAHKRGLPSSVSSVFLAAADPYLHIPPSPKCHKGSPCLPALLTCPDDPMTSVAHWVSQPLSTRRAARGAAGALSPPGPPSMLSHALAVVRVTGCVTRQVQ